MGRKMGVVMTMSGAMSMKVPRNSRMRLMISSSTYSLSEIACRSANSRAGT